MERYIGKMLDNRYEILEIIGQGGMAVVFKAKCHRLNRLVAIKVLKPELADDAEFRRRFHDESQAVAMLSHPNIVSVYDVSKGGGLEYIVMELIDGITLKQYMERRGQLNWREALHFITQVMKALSHAHSRGIIHRDIKPQNIMILRDGSVKVADFGIACLTAKTSQTMAGKEAMGSVHYISPEQAKGERIDERSDIYSAGVVLYEMLTSHLPFEGDTPVSIAIQHFSAVPLNPREINPDIPEALELICLKAMAPQIDRRYRTADDMVRDLEEFRKNPEINFDYDILDLRGEAPIDEPTMMINSKDIQELNTRDDRRDRNNKGNRNQIAAWKKAGLAILGVILCLLLIFGIYRAIFSSFNESATGEYVVPNLLGMTLEDAYQDERIMTEEESQQETPVEGKFALNVIAEQYSEEYAAGEIMAQSPDPDTVRKSDLVINVTLSLGIHTEEMPPLVDLERNAAEALLSSLQNTSGLELNIVWADSVYSETIEAGKVVSTDPAAGDPLQNGDTVTIVSSKGRELKSVTVPSFLTKTREEAQADLDTLGLLGEFVEEANSAPPGTIFNQSIPATTVVQEGSTITLYVSTGPLYDPEGVPSSGDTTDEAETLPDVDAGDAGEETVP